MVILRSSIFIALMLFASNTAALITFADLCFHSRIDHILCQKSIAAPRYLNHFQPTQDFFAGLDPLIANKLANGGEIPHNQSKRLLEFKLLPTLQLLDKRGYDFIRFGRSPERQTKKASSSYDYIRFGKRSAPSLFRR